MVGGGRPFLPEISAETDPPQKRRFLIDISSYSASAVTSSEKVPIETHMHSLEANASPAGRVSDASRDIVGGRISPNINVATPNLVV